MKPTPQLYVGAGAAALAVLLASGSILAGIGSYPVDESKDLTLSVGSDRRAVVKAGAAEEPAVASAAGERRINPFNLKSEVTVRQVAIPMPPPPALRSPSPPLMPVPTEEVP